MSPFKPVKKNWALLGVGMAGSLLLSPQVQGAEPVMDGSMMDYYRTAGPNLIQDGRFEDALRSEQKALKINEEQYGPLHPNLVPILNDLATVQRTMALYKDAEENYKWGLALQEKNAGPQSPEAAESLGYLAGLETDLGRYTEAEMHYQRALDIFEMSAEDHQLALASTLQGLGNLYRLLGKETEARTALSQSLTLQEKQWGPSDLKLIRILEDSARNEVASKDFPAAEKLLKRALSLCQEALPADHVDIAKSEESLAALYNIWGKPEDSRLLYEKAYTIRQKLLGADLFVNLPYLHGAAQTDMALGRWKEAELLLNRVLKLREQFYGPNHPQTAFSLEELAEFDISQGKKSKAMESLKKADQILIKTLGADHPEVQKVEQSLSKLSK